MKIIKSIIGILLFQTLSLFGDVKFDFVYADEPGTGFHIRPEAKAALEEVGRLIGSDWLKRHDATIVMKVMSEEDASDLLLAYVHPVEHLNDIDTEFHRYAPPARKIILGQKNSKMKFDARVTVNFHHPYSFDDKINSNQFDFKTILIHEITHALGFSSKSFKCPGSFLDDSLEELFVHGINAIEGKSDARKLSKLVKKFDLLKSSDFDIDAHILNKADSPLEVLRMGLILEFKRALKDRSPLTVRSELFNQFSNHLDQKGMTIQEFIEYSHSKSRKLLIPDMLLGFHKLSTNASDHHEEKKLRATLITYDLLHDGFNNCITHKINKRINDSPEREDLYRCLQEIILFYAQYLITGTLDDREVARINALISLTLDPLGLSIEQIAQVWAGKTLEPDEIQLAEDYTFFDQFVTQKDGKKFFEGKMDDKIIQSCLLEDVQSNKPLYFSGPNTLKYIGSAIQLNGMDASHIADERQSIMNNASSCGLQSREWDAAVTAIMLDLGYNIDNSWTRLWGHVNPDIKDRTKESRSNTKEEVQKAKTKKSKKAKSAEKKESLKTKSKKEAKKAKRAAKKAVKQAKAAAKKASAKVRKAAKSA